MVPNCPDRVENLVTDPLEEVIQQIQGKSEETQVTAVSAMNDGRPLVTMCNQA